MKKLIRTLAITLILSFFAFAPAFANDSSTAPHIPGVSNYELDGDTTFEVHVAEINALEITLSSNNYNATTHQLILDLVPSSNAPVFNNTSLDITVGTSNITGYSLSMNTVHNNTATTSLTRTESINNTLPTIDTITSAISPNAFISDDGVVNKWGYKLTNTNLDIDKTVYNPITTTSMPLDHTTGYAINTTTIDFGAKVDDTMPAGSYAVELNFTAVTNVVPYIQNILSTECTATPSVYYDIRDNQPYTIQRLNDGRCWMMENLRLGSSKSIALTPDNTNVADNYVLPPSTTGWAYTDVDAYITAKLNSDYNDQLVDAYGVAANNNKQKVGVYYNFCAASANTVCEAETTTSAEYDICPAGWRMPKGGPSGNFHKLLCATLGNSSCGNTVSMDATSVTSMQYQMSLSFAGLYSYGTHSLEQNATARLWSSTPTNTTSIDYLAANPNMVYSRGGGLRSFGYSIRCIIGPVIEDLVYLQDFAALTATQKNNVLLSMEVEKDYTLIDKRDEEEYIIAKLADGNVWLKDNLRLGKNTAITLSSANTNIASTYDLPAGTDTANYNSMTEGKIIIDYKNETVTSYGTGSGKNGVYYNYCAATGGTYCHDSTVGGPDIADSLVDAQYDICPAGWRMPTGSDAGEYKLLAESYNNDLILARDSLSLPLSGLVNFGAWSPTARPFIAGWNTQGFFWSSTRLPSSGNDVYSSRNSASGIIPVEGAGRAYGLTVRCLVKID